MQKYEKIIYKNWTVTKYTRWVYGRYVDYDIRFTKDEESWDYHFLCTGEMNGAGGSQMSLQPVAKYEDEKWLYANVINKIHLVFTVINIKKLYRSNRNTKKR